MSYEKDDSPYEDNEFETVDQDQDAAPKQEGSRRSGGKRMRDEVYSQRVPAGKRTYFFDVKTTRSGEDFFITITESKRVDEGRYEKHKIFLYKEDFGKFVSAMHDVVMHIKDERLPDYEFRGLPDLEASADGDGTETSGFHSNGGAQHAEPLSEAKREEE